MDAELESDQDPSAAIPVRRNALGQLRPRIYNVSSFPSTADLTRAANLYGHDMPDISSSGDTEEAPIEPQQPNPTAMGPGVEIKNDEELPGEPELFDFLDKSTDIPRPYNDSL